MSYILEALKKAQAERQLGALPTIHAPAMQDQAAGARYGKPLRLALGLTILAVLASLALLWRQPWQRAAAPLPAPLPVVAVALPPAPQPRAPVAPAAPRLVAKAPAPVSAPPAAATEDPVLSLRELPEPIQRQIAPLAIGGYIYSKNPADRLLLIDKVLRHEGEELAPGLTLEKLQPKSAIFNFNGYRYRVPY